MKTSNIDKMIASLEPASHPGHKRHHPASHHQAVTVLAVMASVLLFITLIVTVGSHSRTATFAPSTQSVASEAAVTASGISSDFSEVTAGDLGPAILAP